MKRLSGFSSSTAAFLALVMTAGTVAPVVISVPAAISATTTATSLSDVSSNWAAPFIQGLTSGDKPIINGYSDGTFQPSKAVTRAEFAAFIQAAFNEKEVRTGGNFRDVPSKHWASAAIAKAYKTGFMSGDTKGNFRPDDKITRVEALVSLASGLNLSAKGSTSTILKAYTDASKIPTYATNKVAATTEKSIVVNYPAVTSLSPTQAATRADVAAFIYQSLVSKGQRTALASSSPVSKYIASAPSNPNQVATLKVSKSSTIDVNYEQSYVVATPNDTVDITLTVANDIKNSEGKILIPRDSEIEGQLIPRFAGTQFLGTQFVAQKLTIGSDTYNNINATSALVAGQKAPTASNPTWKDAALTAAAQAILSRVNGQKISATDILSSVLTGQIPTTQQNNVIVIEPDKDLKLSLNSDFYVNKVANAGS